MILKVKFPLENSLIHASGSRETSCAQPNRSNFIKSTKRYFTPSCYEKRRETGELTMKMNAIAAAKISRDERGTIAVLAALIVPVIILLGIGALDFSNAVRYKKGMQYSLDAALLDITVEASRMDNSMSDEEKTSELTDRLRSIFLANFNASFAGDTTYTADDFAFSVDLDLSRSLANASVDFNMDTLALGLIDMAKMKIGVDGSAIINTIAENYVIDIVMCIDATGSMQSTIDAVKAGAKQFNSDLRTELGISDNDENIKIRVRPIFYRDWDDQYYIDNYWARPWWWNSYMAYWHNIGQYDGGLVMSEFIDLDPSSSSGISQEDQNEALEDFIGSEKALGGFDWPEGAGACLNEGIRSDWFDNQSQESRDYFNIPSGHDIIQTDEDIPDGLYTKVSTVPVIVFWTDAPINSLYYSQQYLSSTTPTNWSSFEQLWDNENYINQARKILIQFGPGGQGWSQISSWTRYRDGGSLLVGNNDAVKIIAEEIKKASPDVARLAS